MIFNRRGSVFLTVTAIVILICMAVICFADVPYVINNKSEKNKEYHSDENFKYLEIYKAPKDNPTFTGSVNLTSATASGEITTGYGFYHDRGDPSSVDFTSATITMDAAWHDMDLSSIIPDGVKTILMRVLMYTSSGNQMALYFRKNGNTNSNNKASIITPGASKYVTQDLIVSVDSSRIVEYYCTNDGVERIIEITVCGWWK